MESLPLRPLRHHGNSAVGREVQAVTLALAAEIRLVTGLGGALRRQRAAVAADQPDAVEASAAEISGLLLALRDARRERGQLLAQLVAAPGAGIEALRDAFGAVPADLQRAQADLRLAAAEVAREAAINRGILRRVIESGEAFLQQLFTAAIPMAPAYLPRPDESGPPAPVLFNREA